MADSPGGTTIGRVNVKVLPDTSDFRSRAKRELTKVEKELKKPLVQLDLKLDRDSLEKLKKQLRDFARKNDPIKLTVKMDMSAPAKKVAQAQIAVLSRDRTVHLLPVVNSAAAAKAGTALAALSGARVLGSYFDDIAESILRLDKSTPIIGTLALAMAGLAGWGLSAASNLFALSASLAQIGPLALGLPGLFGGIAIGLGISIAALKDFNTMVPQVKAALSTLQNTISTNFWAEFKDPMNELVNSLLPGFIDGMGKAATELGGFFGGLATDLTGALNPLLGQMFSDLASSISIFSGATGALANIIAILGSVGASLLPRMAQWFADITTQFSGFLTQAKNDGSLQTWVDNGLGALAQLGQVLSNLGGILAGLAKAATAGGGSSLGMMADTLERVNKAVNGPAFQGALTSTLIAAFEAMNNIATQAGPAVEGFFASLGGILTSVLPLVGQTIGNLLSSVAEALSQPAVADGIMSMFDGLATGISALLPAIGPIGQALGSLAGVVGTLASVLGPVLGVAFTALSQILVQLTPVIQPLITMLGSALTQVLGILVPVVMQLVQAFMPLIASILPALQQIFSALMPVFSQLLAVLVPIISTLVTGLAPILTIVGQVIAQLVTAIAPLLVVLGNLLGAILTPLMPVIQAIAGTVLPLLVTAISYVVQAIIPLVNALIAVVGFLMPVLAPVITFIANLLGTMLADAIRGVGQLLNGLREVFVGVFNIVVGVVQVAWGLIVAIFTGNGATLKAGWNKLWSGIKEFASGIWDLIKGLWNTLLNVGIFGAFKKVWTALKVAWEGGWQVLKAAGESLWFLIRRSWDNFLTGLKEAPGRVLQEIKLLFQNLWTSLRQTAQAAWDGLKSLFGNGAKSILDKLRNLPADILGVFVGIDHTLTGVGKRLIQGFINGISEMFGAVKGKLGELTSKLTDWKGPESLDRVLLEDAGKLVIGGFINGLESQYDAVRKSLRGLTADVEGTRIGAPQMGQIGAGRTASLALAALAAAGSGGQKVLNYYAAPGSSLGSEEDLFAASNRARMGW